LPNTTSSISLQAQSEGLSGTISTSSSPTASDGEGFNLSNAYSSNNSYARFVHFAPTAETNLSLSWNNGSTYTSEKITTLPSVENITSHGGPTDTWGRSWSPSEFSNGNFRVKVNRTG